MKFKNLVTLFPVYTFLIPFIFILNELRTVYFYYYKTTFADKALFSLVIVLVALLIFLCCRLLTKNNVKAGLLSFFPLLLFVYYFDIFNYIVGFDFVKNIQTYLHSAIHYLMIGIILIIYFVLLIFIIKTKKPFIKLTLYLNIVFSIFLLIEGYKYISIRSFKPELIDEQLLISKTKNDTFPDIYYLVFDGYTSNSSLKKFWNYDNSKIKNFLTKKGFWFSDSSSSNYNATELSKISALNMSYLNIKTPEEFYRINYKEFYKLLNDNLLFRFLKKNNYEIITDYTFDYPFMPWVGPGSIENLYDRTIIYLFQEKFFGPKTPDFYKTYDNQINNVLTAGRKTKPLFYSMHITLPHCPNIYDSVGKKLYTNNSKISFDDDGEKYLEQVKYSNSLIKKMVVLILDKNKDKPIIIIQGDHGFRNLKNLSKKETIEESFSILNAVYQPDNDYSLFYNKMSSVNTFRIVLNKYFGTELKMLDDKQVNIFVN